MVCHVLAPVFFVGWRPKNWGIDTVLLMVLSILIQIEDFKSGCGMLVKEVAEFGGMNKTLGNDLR